MRRTLYSIAFAIAPAAVFAHGGECHSHHWESGLFAGEMRYQFTLMLAVIGAIIVWQVASSLGRDRR